MSLPVAICCHVYLKSWDVIGCLSDHTAFGLMLYVMVCLPFTMETVGGLAIRMLGTFCQLPLTFSYSKTRGIVCSIIAHVPQDDPAQLAIQSAQSISCSAPMTSVPLPLEGTGVAFVVDEVAPPPLLFEPLELPHAASTMARTATEATRTVRVRITRDLPVSRDQDRDFSLIQWGASADAEPQQHCGETEDDRRDDRDPVQVALDRGRSGHRAAQGPPAEHVGESATTACVQQDQEDEARRHGDVEDQNDSGHAGVSSDEAPGIYPCGEVNQSRRGRFLSPFTRDIG